MNTENAKPIDKLTDKEKTFAIGSARFILEDACMERLAEVCGLPTGVIAAAFDNIFKKDRIETLDTSIQRHAEAYKLAATHFLCHTAEYSGSELERLMNLDEDDADPKDLKLRSRIILWQPLNNLDHGMSDPYHCVAELIENLALDILNFHFQS
jgi:hypothetical protein